MDRSRRFLLNSLTFPCDACPCKPNLQGSRRKLVIEVQMDNLNFLQVQIRAIKHKNAYLPQLLRVTGRCYLPCTLVQSQVSYCCLRWLGVAAVNSYWLAIVRRAEKVQLPAVGFIFIKINFLINFNFKNGLWVLSV